MARKHRDARAATLYDIKPAEQSAWFHLDSGQADDQPEHLPADDEQGKVVPSANKLHLLKRDVQLHLLSSLSFAFWTPTFPIFTCFVFKGKG